MSDRAWMYRAIDAARTVVGTTTPNPAVGAVLVREEAVLGIGATQPVGGHHAEVMALADAQTRGHSPAGATMYVTLEPCCHWGRTPPCTDAILSAGIRRVVFGTLDPFPAVGGKGLRALQAADIEVSFGVCERECAELIRGFSRSILHGLPEVGLLAHTFDRGDRVVQADVPEVALDRWLEPHRAEWDAVVLPAARTHLAVPGARRLVVLDPEGVVEQDELALTADRPTLIFTGCATPHTAEVVPRSDGGLATESVLRALVRAGLHRVLFEVPPDRQARLLQSGTVDHVVVVGPRPSSPLPCTAHLLTIDGQRPTLSWQSALNPSAPPGIVLLG